MSHSTNQQQKSDFTSLCPFHLILDLTVLNQNGKASIQVNLSVYCFVVFFIENNNELTIQATAGPELGPIQEWQFKSHP